VCSSDLGNFRSIQQRMHDAKGVRFAVMYQNNIYFMLFYNLVYGTNPKLFGFRMVRQTVKIVIFFFSNFCQTCIGGAKQNLMFNFWIEFIIIIHYLLFVSSPDILCSNL